MNTILEIVKNVDLWMNVAYILAIAFQVSAGLLLIGNTATKREGIIKAYCAQNRGIGFDQEGNLIDYSGLRDVIKKTWINKIAFFYLFVGYLVGVLGEVSINREEALVIIAFLMIPLCIVPYKIAEYKIKKFGAITNDDIPKEGGVMTVIVDNDTNMQQEK